VIPRTPSTVAFHLLLLTPCLPLPAYSYVRPITYMCPNGQTLRVSLRPLFPLSPLNVIVRLRHFFAPLSCFGPNCSPDCAIREMPLSDSPQITPLLSNFDFQSKFSKFTILIDFPPQLLSLVGMAHHSPSCPSCLVDPPIEILRALATKTRLLQDPIP